MANCKITVIEVEEDKTEIMLSQIVREHITAELGGIKLVVIE